jgi:DNA-nicking Smr family endonuclease
MSDKKPEKSPFAGLLADKLKSLDIEPSAPNPDKQAPPEDKKPRAKSSKSSESSESPESRQAPKLSDAELFERSVREMNPEDIYRGKFMGEGPKLDADEDAAEVSERRPDEPETPDAPTEEEAPSDEEAAREAIGEARDIRLFEQAVGSVDKVMRSDKYRRPSMPDPAEDAARRTAHQNGYRSDSPESMITPPLPKSGEGLNRVGPLDAAQRDLHRRYEKRERQYQVKEINVRGDSVEDALRQVELFVHQQWKDDARFVRIIHGRGLQSDGAPVLKPAILHWLEGPGFRYVRGYVPEVNGAGDYGSLIVELERKS